MSIQIENDSEGNQYFRIVRIPVGVGNTTLRIVDTEAEEVAEKICEKRFFLAGVDAVNSSGKKFNSEREVREAVIESAVEIIRDERHKRLTAGTPVYCDGGMF